jgi:hypothetical protein
MKTDGLRDEELFTNSITKIFDMLSHKFGFTPFYTVIVAPVPKNKGIKLYGEEEAKNHRFLIFIV